MDNLPKLILVLLLGNIGISSIGTLFAAIIQLSRTLLSILVLVVLMPMMIPATFALLVLFGVIDTELVGTGALVFVGTLDTAIGYLIAFDAIFVVVCSLLFGVVIRE